MPRFTTAPIEEVAPKRTQRQQSQRAQTQQRYQEALREAIEHGRALVVELEPDDKPLTIRNRMKRAAQSLGLEDVVIRRKKDRIAAYIPGTSEGE